MSAGALFFLTHLMVSFTFQNLCSLLYFEKDKLLIKLIFEFMLFYSRQLFYSMSKKMSPFNLTTLTFCYTSMKQFVSYYFIFYSIFRTVNFKIINTYLHEVLDMCNYGFYYACISLSVITNEWSKIQKRNISI